MEATHNEYEERVPDYRLGFQAGKASMMTDAQLTYQDIYRKLDINEHTHKIRCQDIREGFEAGVRSAKIKRLKQGREVLDR